MHLQGKVRAEGSAKSSSCPEDIQGHFLQQKEHWDIKVGESQKHVNSQKRNSALVKIGHFRMLTARIIPQQSTQLKISILIVSCPAR